MQLDMHYYATFFLAEYSKLPVDDVRKIAYSAQYVDDSTKNDSNQHSDGGLLYGIASAHHPINCVLNRLIDKEEQRRVWVPFHFLPGGEGDSFEENLICRQNSPIAREMFDNHIERMLGKDFQAYLIGVAAHVFMDTFAHYGFSGISSPYNSVVEGSIVTHVDDGEISSYIMGKMGKFLEKYGLEEAARFIAENAAGSLGHGGAMTFPDRPYLHWELDFVKEHPNHTDMTNRRNQETFFEGCRLLYSYLSRYAGLKYGITSPDFSYIEDGVKEILAFEGNKEDRAKKWAEIITADDIEYDASLWEKEKAEFSNQSSSRDGIETNVYRFHEAVTYHRYYVLKDLLPKYGIAIY